MRRWSRRSSGASCRSSGACSAGRPGRPSAGRREPPDGRAQDGASRRVRELPPDTDNPRAFSLALLAGGRLDGVGGAGGRVTVRGLLDRSSSTRTGGPFRSVRPSGQPPHVSEKYSTQDHLLPRVPRKYVRGPARATVFRQSRKNLARPAVRGLRPAITSGHGPDPVVGGTASGRPGAPVRSRSGRVRRRPSSSPPGHPRPARTALHRAAGVTAPGPRDVSAGRTRR